jgi:hypothetical protein
MLGDRLQWAQIRVLGNTRRVVYGGPVVLPEMRETIASFQWEQIPVMCNNSRHHRRNVLPSGQVAKNHL